MLNHDAVFFLYFEFRRASDFLSQNNENASDTSTIFGLYFLDISLFILRKIPGQADPLKIDKTSISRKRKWRHQYKNSYKDQINTYNFKMFTKIGRAVLEKSCPQKCVRKKIIREKETKRSQEGLSLDREDHNYNTYNIQYENNSL